MATIAFVLSNDEGARRDIYPATRSPGRATNEDDDAIPRDTVAVAGQRDDDDTAAFREFVARGDAALRDRPFIAPATDADVRAARRSMRRRRVDVESERGANREDGDVAPYPRRRRRLYKIARPALADSNEYRVIVRSVDRQLRSVLIGTMRWIEGALGAGHVVTHEGDDGRRGHNRDDKDNDDDDDSPHRPTREGSDTRRAKLHSHP